MGLSAARLGDMHVCPKIEPGPKPHVGGPIASCSVPSVLVEGRPAAVAGDGLVCNGPPDAVVEGSSSVSIGGQRAARRGDRTAHGGVIVEGATSVTFG